MRQNFRGYYRPTDEELQELWKNCTFVLDANVLLNLYRYPKEARADLLNLLRQVQDRLWVPYQAALEYQRNRLVVIAEQVKRFGEVRKVVTDSRNQLQSGMAKLDLTKRHSSINPESLLSAVYKLFDDFEKELSEQESQQPNVSDHDEIRDELDTLLDGKIGARPVDQKALDVLYDQGKARYALARPPGYADRAEKNEEDIYLADGLVIKRLYGDLIIWNEMLEKAKTDPKFKYIIFVTDDMKEDWWWIHDFRGQKTIGPRPELVEEIFSVGGVSGFYMYNAQRFLEYAKSNLGAAVTQESIDQVRDIAQSFERHDRNVDESINFIRKALVAVQRWLVAIYPEGHISENIIGFPDFVVTLPPNNVRFGYEVRTIRSPRSARRIIFQTQHKATLFKAGFDDLNIILVADSRSHAESVLKHVKLYILDHPSSTRVFVGFVVSDGPVPWFELLE